MTSMRPQRSMTVSTMARTSSERLTSAPTAIACPPSASIASAVIWAASRLRSIAATVAPSRANSSAAALPLPNPSPDVPAPVTMAILSLSRVPMSILLAGPAVGDSGPWRLGPERQPLRRLRYCLPHFRIVSGNDHRTGIAQRAQPANRLEHLLAIVHRRRQVEGLQRATQVAGVAGHDDVIAADAHAQRLMAGGVAMRRDADHRTVAEDVVLAIDQLHAMPMVVVVRSVVHALDQVRVVPGLPLAALNQQRRIRQQLVAAAVIEMQMRVDDEVDRVGRDVHRLEPRRDLLARFECDLVIGREPSGPPVGGCLRVGVKPAIEDQASLRMLDEIRGHRNRQVPLFTCE